jgi:hercynylcysteine S-oxide lyase
MAESRPDTFLRWTYHPLLLAARTAISTYLNAPLGTCVFTQNATMSVNVVLRNLVFAPGDVIVYFDTIYGACEKTLAYIMETTPVEAVKVEYLYPIADEELVGLFKEKVKEMKGKGKNVRLAVFDTVVSLPGVRMPFERLTEVCREEGVMSCIDGAHGVGHIPLDMKALDPDFFVSNCHKYVLSPFIVSTYFLLLPPVPVLFSEVSCLYVLATTPDPIYLPPISSPPLTSPKMALHPPRLLRPLRPRAKPTPNPLLPPHLPRLRPQRQNGGKTPHQQPPPALRFLPLRRTVRFCRHAGH